MELQPIGDLFAGPGPFVSIYLDARGDVEDAAQRLQTRWKNARRALAAQGADEGLLEQIEQHAGRVQGADADQVHKAKPGGWSQKRYQQRVENRWEENAEEAAQAVHRVAQQVGARLVLVSGDVRAVALLREQLPKATATLVEELDRG